MDFPKVLAYCCKKIPDYEYKMTDFMIYEETYKINDEYSVKNVIKKWDLLIPEPTDEDLNLLTKEEIDESVEKDKEKDCIYNINKKLDLIHKRLIALELK